MWHFSLAVFLVLLLLQLIKQKKNTKVPVKIFQWATIISAVVVLGRYAHLTFSQYKVWIESEFTKHLLPPYQDISYLLGVHGTRFLLYFIISGAAAVLLAFLMNIANKKYEGRFFEEEEKYIAGTAVFLLGNPEWRYAWLFYLCAVTAIYTSAHLLSMAYWKMKKSSEGGPPRIPLYFFWVPTAIAAIIILRMLGSSISL